MSDQLNKMISEERVRIARRACRMTEGETAILEALAGIAALLRSIDRRLAALVPGNPLSEPLPGRVHMLDARGLFRDSLYPKNTR